MKIKEFINQLDSSKDFVGTGMIMDEVQKLVTHIVVRHDPTNVEIKIPMDVIKQSDWNTLCDVMSGKREPAVLQHMTRVVGYYSKIENWNPSKLGELNDRQKGDYELKD